MSRTKERAVAAGGEQHLAVCIPTPEAAGDHGAHIQHAAAVPFKIRVRISILLRSRPSFVTGVVFDNHFASALIRDTQFATHDVFSIRKTA